MSTLILTQCEPPFENSWLRPCELWIQNRFNEMQAARYMWGLIRCRPWGYMWGEFKRESKWYPCGCMWGGGRGDLRRRVINYACMCYCLLEMCVLYWSEPTAQPSGWYGAYIEKEQRSRWEQIRNHRQTGQTSSWEPLDLMIQYGDTTC